MDEESQTIKKNKFSKKVVIIFSLLFILFVIISIKRSYPIINYSFKVKEYLKENYNKNFKIKFVKKGYKREFGTGVFSGLNFSRNSDIEEYIFKVTGKDIDDEVYVTLWKNKKDGTISISEVNGNKVNYTGTGYKDTSYKLYTEKKELKNELTKILKNYNDYEIIYDYADEVYSVDYSIKITFNHSYSEEISNGFTNMEQIINVIKKCDKNIHVNVDFIDYQYFYNKNTNLEQEKEIAKSLLETITFLNNNYNNKYSFSRFDYSKNYNYNTEYYFYFRIIGFFLKDSNKSSNLYNYIYKVVENTSEITFVFEFDDEEIFISKDSISDFDSFIKKKAEN